jgi:hypothetical protein
MQATGTTLAWTFPRSLPAGLICGAALWATASGHQAYAQGIEALELAASPRSPTDILPRPLSAADAARYRRIFEAQDRGDFAAADRELRSLADPLLLGHVQGARLLHPGTRASVEELAAWFARYADHPDAVRIHALLVARLPRGAAAPPAPQPGALPAGAEPENGAPIDEALQAAARNQLERSVRDRARAGDARGALAAIAAARPDAETRAMLRGQVAHALFLLNRDAEALAIARESGDAHFLPLFAGGLAAFRLDRPAEAMGLFVRAHGAPQAQPAQKSAAAFWAARSAPGGRSTTRPGSPRRRKARAASMACWRGARWASRPASPGSATGWARPRRRCWPRPATESARWRCCRSASASAPSARSGCWRRAPRTTRRWRAP